MDLEELRSVREQERRTDSLQHLRDSFYDDAADYVRELKRERTRRAEAAGDPYAADAMRLTDEIDTAEEVIESLYERRRGKVVKLASFAAAGMPAETDGMTDQERAMFDDVVARIEANEAAVLGALDDGDADTGASVAGGGPTADAGSVGDAVSANTESVGAAGATDATSTESPTTAEEPTHVIGDPESVDGGPQSTAEEAADEPVPTPGAGEAAAGAVSPSHGDGSVAPPAPDEQGVGGDGPADVAGAEADAGSGVGDGDDVLADAMGGGDTPGAGAAGDGATDTASAAADAGTASGSAGTATESGVETATESAAGTSTETAGDAAGVSAAGVETGVDDESPRPTAEAAAVSGGEADRPVAEAAAAAGPEPTGGDGVGQSAETGGTDQSAETDGTDQSVAGTDDAQASGGDETATVAVDRTTVRVTSDVGEIFGVDDRSYELRAGDVVTLPSTNVDPLVDRGAAERLE